MNRHHPQPAEATAGLTWRDLGVRWTSIAGAMLAGSAALGSAVGLAAISAWLIARAAQMPSPADLAIAAVLVRTLGISRGALRYVERLRSHDVALRGVASLRARTYERLEEGGTARVLALPRGDIVARLGTDVDAIGDAVVKALVPAGVAVIVSALSVGIVASQHRGAAAALAFFLVLSAGVPPLLTARATKIASVEGSVADAAVAIAAMSAMDGAAEHRVWGTLPEAFRALKAANTRAERAREAEARPAALAAALQVLASGAAVVMVVAIGIAAVHSGDLTGPAAAVVALTPLAAFEAVNALPAASAQAFRSRAAAARVREIVEAAGSGSATTPSPSTGPALAVAGVSNDWTLNLDRVRAAWPGVSPTRAVTLRLRPGGVVGVVGPSGVGKTTLLLTIAGALTPVKGRVTLDGHPVTPEDTGTRIAMTAEDAHVFGTSILENLRVARGDVTTEEAQAKLDIVGLGPWLSRQPSGLDTLLGSGGLSISGGERRRLLLARALLSPAPIHLVDEPAEHMDDAGEAVVRDFIAEGRIMGRGLIVVTHDRSLLDVVDTVIDLG